jgi:hypothetical protein
VAPRPEQSNDRAAQSRLLTSPFISSWIGEARSGADRFDGDLRVRTAGWAQWAVEHLVEMTGARDRVYPAFLLEGRFHDPRGRGPLQDPHLEIPRAVLSKDDTSFPLRIALLGNALAFPWWLPDEVMAVKRAAFIPGAGAGDLGAVLAARRADLVATAAALHRQVAGRWEEVEKIMFAAPGELAASATGGFGSEEIAEVLPDAAVWQMRVVYDPVLAEKAGEWASRRLGVWQIRARAGGQEIALGVLTPRLTANSQFIDPLFAIEKESPAALLVRICVLRRIASRHLGIGAPQTGLRAPVAPLRTAGAHLRAVVAKVGSKLPEASVEAAVHFLHTYPTPDEAWEALSEWAGRTGTLLTVSEEGFRDAHRRAQRFVRRAEDPERDDVNVLLPLGWDERSRVVRVSFSRPAE